MNINKKQDRYANCSKKMKTRLNGVFRLGLSNLRPKYNGFKILRGYERGTDKYKIIVLFIIKVKNRRTGVLTRFCKDRLKENKSIVIVNPTNQEMVNFLHKNRFVKCHQTDKNDYWILTPLTPQD